MTKKDYELFASTIHGYEQRAKGNPSLKVPPEIFNTWVDICCECFKADNFNFNEEKFKEACYEGKHIRKSIKERA